MTDGKADALRERPLTPEDRARGGTLAGVPVALKGGSKWVLAHGRLDRVLDDWRDRLFDSMVMRGQVVNREVWAAGYLLLRTNYQLNPFEALELFEGADEAQAVADAVMEALFGPERPRRTYSTWARASLYANALDPRAIPPEDLPRVLDILIATRRTLPMDRYLESYEAKSIWDASMGHARPRPD